MGPYHIIVAVDGSEESDRAVEWAAMLAQCRDVALTVVHVVSKAASTRVPRGMEEYAKLEHVTVTHRDLLHSAGEKIVARAALRAEEAGAPKVDTTVLAGDPAVMLTAAAEDLGADLVVMGCRGLSHVPGMMLGSVSHRMLHSMDRGAVLAVH